MKEIAKQWAEESLELSSLKRQFYTLQNTISSIDCKVKALETQLLNGVGQNIP